MQSGKPFPKYLAHLERDDQGEIKSVQKLTDHLINVGEISAEIGKEIDCYHLSYLIGISHDLGKVKNSFQLRILGENKANVNHSSAGASYLWNRMQSLTSQLQKRNCGKAAQRREIIFYVITAHHGLYDIIGEGQNIPGKYISRILDRMELQEDKIALEKEINPYVQAELEPALQKSIGISLNDLILLSMEELQVLSEKIESLSTDDPSKQQVEIRAYEGFLTRLLLSILKTADCLDSSQWDKENKINPLSKNDLENIFSDYHILTEERAAKFASTPNPSPLNQSRTYLSQLAQEHALKQACGVSQFDMPTGAGKTEAGLRYAVNNIHHFKKSRMLYTAPFLSIVEQSAETIKKVVKDDTYVLEHHSNIINEEDPSLDETIEEQKLYLPQSYMTDYWDAAIIVTTMVQFYHTLFGGKAANICRFCKLIDSTIIIDEIQSLPVNHIYPFNLMLNFLSSIMKVNVLACSATQPPFDHPQLDYPLRFSNQKQVIPENNKLENAPVNYDVFERSQVFPAWHQIANEGIMTLEDVLDLLNDHLQWADSALCILNTKSAVKSLFDRAQETFPTALTFYLTTNLCAAHRLDRIEEIKKILKDKRQGATQKSPKLICVTTSLIEAGVDVDFDIVLRSITGADSIEQARGRCNREGLLTDGGKVFILNLLEDNTDVKGLKDIYRRGQITKTFTDHQVQDAETPLNMRKLTEDFYQKYFINHTDEMVYPIPHLGSNAVELLSTNDSKLKAVGNARQQKVFQINHRLFQAFKSASKEMKLIDQDTKSVIVSYKNQTLLGDLKRAVDHYEFGKARRVLKKLQRYTVNIPIWQEPDNQCDFVFQDEKLFGLGIYILRAENYDPISGIQLSDESNEAFLF